MNPNFDSEPTIRTAEDIANNLKSSYDRLINFLPYIDTLEFGLKSIAEIDENEAEIKAKKIDVSNITDDAKSAAYAYLDDAIFNSRQKVLADIMVDSSRIGVRGWSEYLNGDRDYGNVQTYLEGLDSSEYHYFENLVQAVKQYRLDLHKPYTRITVEMERLGVDPMEFAELMKPEA